MSGCWDEHQRSGLDVEGGEGDQETSVICAVGCHWAYTVPANMTPAAMLAALREMVRE